MKRKEAKLEKKLETNLKKFETIAKNTVHKYKL